MRTFFTSDLHLGHEKVAQIRGFNSTEEHDAILIAGWLTTVDEGDEVYVLGDIAKAHSVYALTVLKGLPGVKHLVAGNHDRVHPCFPNNHRYLREYLETFETVQERITLRIDGRKVTLSHFPFTEDHKDPPRYMAYRVQDEGQWLIHGHVHSPHPITGPREIHVGVDAWDLKPAPLYAVEDQMRLAERIVAFDDAA